MVLTTPTRFSGLDWGAHTLAKKCCNLHTTLHSCLMRHGSIVAPKMIFICMYKRNGCRSQDPRAFGRLVSNRRNVGFQSQDHTAARNIIIYMSFGSRSAQQWLAARRETGGPHKTLALFGSQLEGRTHWHTGIAIYTRLCTLVSGDTVAHTFPSLLVAKKLICTWYLREKRVPLTRPSRFRVAFVEPSQGRLFISRLTRVHKTL